MLSYEEAVRLSMTKVDYAKAVQDSLTLSLEVK